MTSPPAAAASCEDVAGLDERRLTADPVRVVIHEPRSLQDRYKTVVVAVNITDRYDALSGDNRGGHRESCQDDHGHSKSG